jgi:hypothetical protein
MESVQSNENSEVGWRFKHSHLVAVLFVLLLLYGVVCFADLDIGPSALDDGMSVSSDGGGDETRSESRASAEDDPCIDCHESSGILEAIIVDWASSEHADEEVSCIDCHEGEPSDPDTVEHYDYYVSVVVSPKDCAECHPDEVEQFDRSLHALGSLYYEDLFTKGKLNYLESQIEGSYIVVDDIEQDHAATLRGCQACHGTNMTGKTVEDWTVWPNNGIGRINPDGSMGSCSACHSRHSFSVAEARHPETCGQCHMGPDHPQIEIYMESKHGNIYSAEGDSWNWDEDDWKAGEDYRAPTCAGCHMSSAPGVPVTHDVSDRLSWELETAISKHTDNTANALGLPISDGTTWQVKRDRMMKVCQQCHSETWVDNYYKQADLAVDLYNQQYSSALVIMDALYEEELLTTDAFDEPIEFKIYEMWHHEGRRARMGAFMQGPDYVQWHGFYDMFQDRVEIEHMAEEIRAEAAEQQGHENGDDEDEDEGDLIGWSIPIALFLGFLALAVAIGRGGKS